MSERKVLNKYYPPDFDPSKIPRARCPRNRQFTVRLMVPCNIKCYTCGEYIAKGKKFNARKEDVENMTYLGVRIYRFYIKCPGCLAEISFRTDPESTDYVIEAGAHRNFQALKLAEEQAAREEREAKEEIESNPMLLLENRTQQSQYEMEVLESLEDLREMNDRHAGIDPGKIAEKFEIERKMTQEQIEEMEKSEALKALGYEMVEGQMVRRIAPEGLNDDERLAKKVKREEESKSSSFDITIPSQLKTNMKSRLAGVIKRKSPQETSTSCSSDSKISKNSIPLPHEEVKLSEVGIPQNVELSTYSKISIEGESLQGKVSTESPPKNYTPTISTGLLSLGAYSDSESDSN